MFCKGISYRLLHSFFVDMWDFSCQHFSVCLDKFADTKTRLTRVHLALQSDRLKIFLIPASIMHAAHSRTTQRSLSITVIFLKFRSCVNTALTERIKFIQNTNTVRQKTRLIEPGNFTSMVYAQYTES